MLRSRWLDSLIFNDEVEAYKSWTLFLIFISILVLISGVVLLTHKKPQPIKSSSATQGRRRKQKRRNRMAASGTSGEEGHSPRGEDDGEEEQALWALGEESDEEDMGEDEDVDHHQNPVNHRDELEAMKTAIPRHGSSMAPDELTELVKPDLEFADDELDRRRGTGVDGLDRSGSASFRPRR